MKKYKDTRITSWLAILPYPYNNQALYNHFIQGIEDRHCNNTLEAIDSFDWSDTTEGFEYWFNFSEKINNNTIEIKEYTYSKENSKIHLDKLKETLQ